MLFLLSQGACGEREHFVQYPSDQVSGRGRVFSQTFRPPGEIGAWVGGCPTTSRAAEGPRGRRGVRTEGGADSGGGADGEAGAARGGTDLAEGGGAGLAQGPAASSPAPEWARCR